MENKERKSDEVIKLNETKRGKGGFGHTGSR